MKQTLYWQDLLKAELYKRDIIMTELLAPAGDFECLEAAINYGCDAVYLGGKGYGMRAASKNFDFDELKKAADLAHSKGVRVACSSP